jgi:SecD/SecF fusion protein
MERAWCRYKDGYNHSYSAIIDANVTTLLTGVILYWFGTGPIRGFATTLIIGILTSLFCAIFVSRLIFEWRLSKKSDVSFYTKFTKDWWTNVNINFLSEAQSCLRHIRRVATGDCIG